MRRVVSRPLRLGAACVVFLFGMGHGPPSAAHEWYPVECCSGLDCAPVSGDVDVTATKGGWRINATGEVLPFGDPRVRQTPAEAHDAYHRCSVSGNVMGRTICLFVPPVGS